MDLIKYDYKCDPCDLYFRDMLIPRKDKDTQRCSKCEGLLKRLMPGPITTFKFGDRSAIKSKKAVSLRDPTGSGHGKPWDIDG